MSESRARVLGVDGEAAGADVRLRVEEMKMSAALTCRIVLASACCVRTRTTPRLEISKCVVNKARQSGVKQKLTHGSHENTNRI